MLAWWDSLDAVYRFNTIMQVAILTFGVLTATAGIMSFFATRRIDALQAESNEKLQKRLSDAEHKLSGRHLSDEDRAALVSNLLRFAKQAVDISATTSDAEAFTFATEIATTLKDAGWQVIGPDTRLLIGLPTTQGVTLTVDDANEAPIRAVELHRAMRSLGITVHVSQTGQAASDRVSLFVGPAPR